MADPPDDDPPDEDEIDGTAWGQRLAEVAEEGRAARARTSPERVGGVRVRLHHVAAPPGDAPFDAESDREGHRRAIELLIEQAGDEPLRWTRGYSRDGARDLLAAIDTRVARDGAAALIDAIEARASWWPPGWASAGVAWFTDSLRRAVAAGLPFAIVYDDARL